MIFSGGFLDPARKISSLGRLTSTPKNLSTAAASSNKTKYNHHNLSPLPIGSNAVKQQQQPLMPTALPHPGLRLPFAGKREKT